MHEKIARLQTARLAWATAAEALEKARALVEAATGVSPSHPLYMAMYEATLAANSTARKVGTCVALHLSALRREANSD